MVGLVLAAVVAYCNATSSARLAAQYPSSGGTYLVNYRGITRTARLTRVIVTGVVAALAVAIAASWIGADAAASHLRLKPRHSVRRAPVGRAAVRRGTTLAMARHGDLLRWLTQDLEHPRPLQVAGVLGCGALALTVPAESLVGGVVVLAAGSGYRLWRLRHAGK